MRFFSIAGPAGPGGGARSLQGSTGSELAQMRQTGAKNKIDFARTRR